jgi:DNA repair protein RadA/Sms
VIEAVNNAAAPATKSASRLKQLRSDAVKAVPPSSTAWIAKQSDANDDGPEPLMSDSKPDEASAGFAARIPRIRLTQSPEVNRTFGGGIVPGSLTLLAGDPGIGKSTLVLQLTRWLADALPNKPVLYVSGEETSQQLRMRADRLSISSANCLLWNESDVDRILEKAASINAGALVLDSVQTMQCADVAGTPGAVSQLREVTARCLRAAKSIQLPVILIGHVTKSGS